jgi:hypothetical protein
MGFILGTMTREERTKIRKVSQSIRLYDPTMPILDPNLNLNGLIQSL